MASTSKIQPRDIQAMSLTGYEDNSYLSERENYLQHLPSYQDDRGNFHQLPMTDEHKKASENTVAIVDGALLARANELELSYEELLEWCNSKFGKWFANETLNKEWENEYDLIDTAYQKAYELLHKEQLSE